jgi:hypothetical protein
MTREFRPIAFYLPQFHRVPENDRWWGEGFTEWVNVKKAKPLFIGHHQPHIPAELGYYDLLSPATRVAQAKLAKEHGICGFCYYHYWFNGRRILERPFDEVFETGKPDFPFMLCWANENWTRTWDGRDKDVLLEQNYSEEDDRAHIRHLIKYFKDDRYIKVGGKPVIAIYKSFLLPNSENTISIFREEARKEGMELYICRVENHGHYGEKYMQGFDAAIDFQPFGGNFPSFHDHLEKRARKKLARRILNKFYTMIGQKKKEDRWNRNYYQRIDYNEFVDYSINKFTRQKKYKLYPGIFPGWDNSPRRGEDSLIFKNANPEAFRNWLENITKQFKPYSPEENFIFINAWNEWGEGNHLEPCEKWGRGYLEAVKDVINTQE